MFALAVTGKQRFDKNEPRVAGYVMDIVHRGHWICQRDTWGNIASKPPLFSWIAATATLPFGRMNAFSLYFPSGLATVLVSLILLRVGTREFGWQSGLLAATTYLVSAVADKQMLMARYDALLALPVTLGALAAYRAWLSGRGWLLFWLAAAAATLVKGPIGIILAAGGLCAAFWEKRSGTASPIRGSHWLGIATYLAICGGWLALAYLQMGQPLLDKLLGRELLDHAVGTNTNHMPFGRVYAPTFNFLQAFAPWSIVTCIAIWRTWRHPAPVEGERKFERFLVCWFVAGLVLFSIAAHQRGRLILPLIPAAALLAGRELACWVAAMAGFRLYRWTMATAAVFLLFVGFFHHVLIARSADARNSLALRDFANEIRSRFGDQTLIYHHFDSPFELQFYLNSPLPVISSSEAARLIESKEPALIAIADLSKVRAQLSTGAVLYPILTRTNPKPVHLVSNVPHPEAADKLAHRPRAGVAKN